MAELKPMHLSPRGIIPEIKRLLRSDYPLSALLRELMQNADDAEAGVLRLVHLLGEAPDHPHPLLRHSALLVLNDGHFVEDDLEAIATFGASFKVRQAERVGTFGLGMKTVFHLCEAFFFAASGRPKPDHPPRDTAWFVNPWAHLTDHRDWDDLAGDEEVDTTVIRLAGDLASDFNRWFCLWLPLRPENSGAAGAPVLYPAKPLPVGSMRGRHALEALPLLDSLRRVEFVEARRDGARHEIWSVEYAGTPSRGKDTRADQVQLDGTLVLTESGQAASYRVCGAISRGEDPALAELKSEDSWERLDTPYGEVAVEKAPEAGVAFVELPTIEDQPCLEVSEYIALPLSHEPERVLDHGLADTVRLILHGSFFTDAGRRAIARKQPTDASESASARWNRRLENAHVAPMLLPALAKFSEGAGLEGDIIADLTTSVATALKGEARRELREGVESSDVVWRETYVQSAGLTGGFRFRLLSKHRRQLALPGTEDVGLPARLFRQLPDLSRTADVVLDERPCVPDSASELPVAWNSAEIDAVLGAVDPVCLETKAGVAYLAKAVDEWELEEVPRAFVAAVRTAIETTEDRMPEEEAAALFKGLLRVLPERNLLSLWKELPKFEERERRNTANVLASALPERLLLTPSMDREGTCLSSAEAAEALRAIGEATSETSLRERTEELSIAILRKTTQYAECLVRNSDDELIRALPSCTLGTDDGDVTVPFRDLLTLCGEGRLLRSGGWAEPIREAFEPRLLIVRQECTSRLLGEVFGDDHLSAGAERALALLDGQTVARAASRRARLLSLLLKERVQTKRKAWRYLLHGSADGRDALLPDLLERRGDEERVWERLAHEAVEAWRVLPRELMGDVTDNQRRDLGIAPLGSAEIVRSMVASKSARRNGVERAYATSEPEEQEEVLETILELAPEGWEELRLHRTTENEYVALDRERHYFEDAAVPDSLRAVVTLLANRRASCRERYRKAGVASLGTRQIIEVALRQPDPSAHYLAILSSLGSLQEKVSVTLTDRVKEVAWLSTEGGLKPAAPRDVINVPDLEALMRDAALEEVAGPGTVFLWQLAPTVREHEAFESIRGSLLPSADESIERLVSGVHSGVLSLGAVDLDRIGEGLELGLEALGTVALPPRETARVKCAVMIAARLAKQDGGTRAERGESLRRIFTPAPLERTLAILKELGEAARKEEGSASEPAILSMRKEYLQLVADDPTLEPKHFVSHRFRSCSNEWRSGEELTLDVAMVSDAATLAPEDAQVLRRWYEAWWRAAEGLGPEGTVIADAGDAENGSGQRGVEEYFLRWEGCVPDAALGLVTCFFSTLSNFSERLLASRGGRERVQKAFLSADTPKVEVRKFPRAPLGMAALADWVLSDLEGIEPVRRDPSVASRLKVEFRPVLVSPSDGTALVRTLGGVRKRLEGRNASDYREIVRCPRAELPSESEKPVWLERCQAYCDLGESASVIDEPCPHWLVGDLDSQMSAAAQERQKRSGSERNYRASKSAHDSGEARSRSARKAALLDWSRAVAKTVEVQITAVDPRTVDASQRETWLLAAVRRLAYAGWRVWSARQEEYWKSTLDQSQITMEQTQNLLLANLERLLDGISAPAREEDLAWLRRLRQDLRNARFRFGDQQGIEELGKRGRDTFRQMMRNVEAQRGLLSSIRDRMREHQYVEGRVIHELFQNADDAAIQGVQVGLGAATQFFVHVESTCLSVGYGGRQVNRFQSPTFSAEEGIGRGFADDLTKMLTFGESEKQDWDGRATGRFGYGFKSVYLLTDRPEVMSGGLAFAISAGLWPAELASDERGRLRQRLVSMGLEAGDHGDTVIALPLVSHVSAPQVLQPFREAMLGVLAFSRQMKEVQFLGPLSSDETERHFTWRESGVSGTEQVRVGSLWVDGTPREMALVFRSPEGGDSSQWRNVALMGLGRGGPEPLPPEMASLWATLPTEERLDAGVAINGTFSLDVGRSQVGVDRRRSDDAIRQARVGLGRGLLELWAATEEDSAWERFKEVVGLDGKTERVGFNLRLWHVLSRRSGGGGAGDRVMRAVLWGDREDPGAARTFFSEEGTLPTGLWGEWEALTGLGKVRGYVEGLLEVPGVGIEALRLDGVRETWPVGSLVSGQKVAKRMSEACAVEDLRAEWQPLRLKEVIETYLRSRSTGRRLDPRAADALGRLCCSDAWKDQIAEHYEEAASIQELCNGLLFYSAVGSWAEAWELCSPEPGAEDALVVGFAPARAVLHPSHGRDGQAFRRYCRGERRPASEMVAAWARERTVESDAMAAFLQFLLRSTRAREVASCLEKEPGFRRRVSESAEYRDLSERDKLSINGLLGLGLASGPVGDLEAFRAPDAATFLRVISEWWEKKGPAWTRRYEESVYPRAMVFRPSDKNTLLDGEDRRKWLTLLILGACHTMGRTRPGQHRAFLEQCEAKGWMDVFAAEEMASEKWMGVLEHYLDDDSAEGAYREWMKLFLAIFQAARWLPDYVEVLTSADRCGEALSLTDVVSPRRSQRFGRGGPNPPGLGRALGLGACFVLRELRRTGVVATSGVDRLCFVPSKKVRSIFQSLGCGVIDGPGSEVAGPNSTAIYEFLKKHVRDGDATFKGSFDLPFLTYAYESRAEEEVNQMLALDGEQSSAAIPGSPGDV